MTSYEFNSAHLQLMFTRSRYDTSPDQSTIVTISMAAQVATMSEYISTLNTRIANAMAGTGISITFYLTSNGHVQMIASTTQSDYIVNGTAYYYLSIIVNETVASSPISLLIQLGWDRSQFLIGNDLYTIIWTDQRTFNSTANNLPQVFPISGATNTDSGKNSGGTQDNHYKNNQWGIILLAVLIGLAVVISIIFLIYLAFKHHTNTTTDFNTDQTYTDFDQLHGVESPPMYESLGI